MHSDTMEKSASPRKRLVSRAMSEEESLRHIIEAEESPKRLTRRDSRFGSFRRGDTRGSQSEDEPADNTSMLELQQDYEMCLAELRSAELRQEVLLFQVDCLQDALEGAEEMLAETKREAHQFSMELEQEREQRRKLENNVELLMQELERVKEEKYAAAAETTTEEQKEASDETDSPAAAAAAAAAAADDDDDDDDDTDGCVSKDPKSEETALQPAGSTNSFATFAAATYLLFKNSRFKPNSSNQIPTEGTSVDQEVKEAHVLGSKQAAAAESNCKAHDTEEHDESSGYEDAPSDFSPSTPDGASDTVLPEDEESELKNRDPKDPDACFLS